MRPVDTRALEAVARSLGIAAPATALAAVDFDDAILQQVLDVGLIARYAAAVGAGVPNRDGWSLFNMELAMLTGVGEYATQNVFSQANCPNAVLPASGATFWVYGVHAQLEASDALSDFANAHLTVEYRSDLELNNQANRSNQIPVAYFADSFYLQGTALRATLAADRVRYGSWPMPVPQGSIFRLFAVQDTATGTLSLRVSILGRVLPMGVPPGAF